MNAALVRLSFMVIRVTLHGTEKSIRSTSDVVISVFTSQNMSTPLRMLMLSFLVSFISTDVITQHKSTAQSYNVTSNTYTGLFDNSFKTRSFLECKITCSQYNKRYIIYSPHDRKCVCEIYFNNILSNEPDGNIVVKTTIPETQGEYTSLLFKKLCRLPYILSSFPQSYFSMFFSLSHSYFISWIFLVYFNISYNCTIVFFISCIFISYISISRIISPFYFIISGIILKPSSPFSP